MNSVIKCKQGCLLRRKMTKLHNSYPEDIACVPCFPCVFQMTEEAILGLFKDWLCCQFLDWKLQVDLTAKKVHSEWTYMYFNCYTFNWKRLSLQLKPLKWNFLSDFSEYFLSRLFSYTDEFNKHGIGEVQWLFQSIVWYIVYCKQRYLLEETETREHDRNTQFLKCFSW